MAAAEARAAWQRAANRCFFQEDAKRAPKLACCQSSSSSSRQVEAGATNPVDGLDNHPLGFMPFNRKPSFSNLPPDARWWLQKEPNCVHHRGLTYEQLNTLASDSRIKETDSEEVQSWNEEGTCVLSYLDMESSGDMNSKTSTASLKNHPEVIMENRNDEKIKIDQDYLDVKEMTDYYEYMEMELVGGSVFKRYNSSDSDSSWVGGDKVPWWRRTDKDELASFVSQKSVHEIVNCDLPPPQKMHTRKEPFGQVRCFGRQDEIFVSSHEQDVQSYDVVYSPTAMDTPSPRSVGTRGSNLGSSKREGQTQNGESELQSASYMDLSRKSSISDSDPCKAQLIEALCHSQTRAREAENAAKQAYTEKEHIVKLFLRQASHLFAYKQWFRLLQLESYLLVNNTEATPPLFPILAPCTPVTAEKQHRSFQEAAKLRRRKQRKRRLRFDLGKYAVAFAVGLGLVSAGLLLGWTVGWLFPAL